MKRALAAALALILILMCAGCGAAEKTAADGAAEETAAAGDYLPMLMVDGILYQSTGEPAPVEPAESVIRSVGSYTDTEPAEDGQQNFDRACAVEYAMTSDGLMVLLDHEWVRFDPVEPSS